MLSHKEVAVISSLITLGTIPGDDVFEITEHHLTKYVEQYHIHFGKSDKGTATSSNTRFARRLAGRTFVSLNSARGAKFNEIKAGLVYLIENPAFPLHYKVGITLNVKKRLSQYQTYSPYRDFKIVKYDFVLDRSGIEKQILNHPDINNELGEWVLKDSAINIFSTIIY